MTERKNRPSLFSYVLDLLGRDIVQGKFLATGGSLPREQDLCDYLGASRTVVREVTRVLAEKGMLRATPKIGIRVTPETEWNVMDIDVLKWIWQYGRRENFVRDFLEFRLIFEPMASFQAAVRATQAQRQEILDLYGKLLRSNETLLAGGDHAYSISCDIAFHSAIYKASGNRMLSYLGSMISEMMARQVRETTSAPGQFGLGLPLHEKVAQAIAAGDASVAHHYSQMLVRMPYEDYLTSTASNAPQLGIFSVRTPEMPLLTLNEGR
ncbi:FadR/GntR family transcriptional regulator [Aestuariivirga sp.]|uniref:FadR/GntR family transcriptional regulator n=1 Tax=Aestuariivirga sp. TaxID=2650926 RepID=UPI003BA9FFFE